MKRAGMVMDFNRVVITGIGVVSSLGVGKQEFWTALQNGSSGVKRITTFNTDRLQAKTAACIRGLNDKKRAPDEHSKTCYRSSNLLTFAAKLAIEDARMVISDNNTDEIGVCAATTLSNIRCFARLNKEVVRRRSHFIKPFSVPNSLLTAPSSLVCMEFNIQGFNAVVSTGFTASLDAIEYAINLIRLGRIKAVLVAGVEEVVYEAFLGFYKMGVLAGIRGKELSCPFDKRRNGMVLGEGAACLIIENESCAVKRKARIYAKVLGLGSSFDPRVSSKFSQRVCALQRSMASALDFAGIATRDVDCISATANSTPRLDKVETMAIKRVFGDYASKIPVTAIKSMLGETLSVAGLFQVACVIGMMERGFIAPTINQRMRDDNCNLDYVPNRSIRRKIKTALINNWGGTGHSRSLIISSICSNHKRERA